MATTKKSKPPATSNKSITYRIAASHVTETRLQLDDFVQRFPEFRAEIDAAPLGLDGQKVVYDLDAVRYDIAGLADLLEMLEDDRMNGHVPVYESLNGEDYPNHPIEKPTVEPVAYNDSLALVVARLHALRERLDSYLVVVGCSDFGTDKYKTPHYGDYAARFRNLAWAIRQALKCTAAGVYPDKLAAAKAMLAGALNVEVAAADAEAVTAVGA